MSGFLDHVGVASWNANRIPYERVGEMIKGLAYTVGCRHGKEDVVTAVVGDCRGEVKSPSPMFCP